MKKFIFIFFCTFLTIQAICSQNALLIQPQDIKIVEDGGNSFDTVKGFHLYIKKKPGLESVMLTETTKDPNGIENNYSYRATEYNPINGDEIRILDSKKLESETARYFLISSTPTKIEDFGECFHIYIPSVIVYGFPWSRNGTVRIGKGTFINIRAFSKKYCDYTGNYFDNPYMFNLERRKILHEKIPVVATKSEDLVENDKISLTDDYNPIAAEKFKELSDNEMIFSEGPKSLVDDIMSHLDKINPKDKVDVVFAIDATGSMKDDIEILRKDLIARLQNSLPEYGQVRFGLLLYRDYNDNFIYKKLPVKFFDFTDNLKTFSKNLNGFVIKGNEGGDIPEAVYEAIYASVEFYSWRADAVKKVILIGDAEPHPTPRGSGKYSREFVEKCAEKKGVSISTIIVPDDKARRGR